MYEYQCATCGKVFELIQRFSDAPLVVHEGCGGPLERLVSAPALQFKGSGWYVNDYAKSSSKGEGKSESKSETKSEGKKDDAKPAVSTETKTESKPAASGNSKD